MSITIKKVMEILEQVENKFYEVEACNKSFKSFEIEKIRISFDKKKVYMVMKEDN